MEFHEPITAAEVAARYPDQPVTVTADDAFTLTAQTTERTPSARDILTRLSAEVVYVNDPVEGSAVIQRLLDKTERISQHPGASGGLFGLDIETAALPAFRHDSKAGLDPYKAEIRLIQLFDPVGYCYVFDMRKIPLSTIQPLIEARETVAHNALFEMRHLRHAGIKPKRLHCSLLMARVVSGQPMVSLAKAALNYLSVRIDKTLQVSNWNADTLSQEQIDYAALDAVLAREFWRVLGEKVKASGQSAAYRRFAAVIPVIADQTLAGMGFDQAAHREMIKGWQTELEPLRETLTQELNGINPDSPAQLAGWLAKTLDKETLDAWPKTPSGQLATGADTLADIDHPAIATLKRYAELTKAIATYGTGYASHIHPVTGRIHADYGIAGTRGGRFSY